jgi:hypothetical protein
MMGGDLQKQLSEPRNTIVQEGDVGSGKGFALSRDAAKDPLLGDDDMFSDNQGKQAYPSITSKFEFQENKDEFQHAVSNKSDIDNLIKAYHRNAHQDSIYKASVNQPFLRQASMVDPDKKDQLMKYKLPEFTNSIRENFLGSQVQISKTYEADGTYKITNQNFDKMGPVQVRIEEGNLYSAWEKSRRSEIDDWEDQKKGQRKTLETWVCQPPNMLMFQINRVGYNNEKQKSVKDNYRFDFDQEIYLDLFLKINRETSDEFHNDLNKKLEILNDKK